MSKLLHTPEGVRDIIGDECQVKHEIIEGMAKIISTFGYDRLDTPTFEYLDTFTREAGSTDVRNLYKFFDNSGNILSLRPDFTPSIARVCAKYFSNDKKPLRIFYQGNVFKAHDSYRGLLSETTQLGAELIGDPSIEADCEIIAMACGCIKSCGIDDFQISIGHSRIFTDLCKEAGIESSDKETLRELITNKNVYGMVDFLSSRGVKEDLTNIFRQCMEPCIGKEQLRVLLDLTNPYPDIFGSIIYLSSLLELMEIYQAEKYLTVDLSIISSYDYYTGIIFYANTYGSGSAILSGGRYDDLLGSFGKNACAVGFAIYCDNLLMALEREGGLPEISKKTRIVFYKKEDIKEAINKAREDRNNGERVLLVQYSTDDELASLKEIYKKDI